MQNQSESVLIKLLDQARGGDEQARDRLLASCRNYVSVVARAQVGSWLQAKVDASDLVQQTMLDAYRGLLGFRGQTEAEWLAWLRRILAHNAADFVRHYRGTDKRGAGRELPLRTAGYSDDGGGTLVAEPADPGESPSQLLMRKEREIELADAIAKLSDDYQEVIVLRNLERLPFDQIAERMGRSRPAVQMLWMRAIRSLQDGVRGQE